MTASLPGHAMLMGEPALAGLSLGGHQMAARSGRTARAAHGTSAAPVVRGRRGRQLTRPRFLPPTAECPSEEDSDGAPRDEPSQRRETSRHSAERRAVAAPRDEPSQRRETSRRSAERRAVAAPRGEPSQRRETSRHSAERRALTGPSPGEGESDSAPSASASVRLPVCVRVK